MADWIVITKRQGDQDGIEAAIEGIVDTETLFVFQSGGWCFICHHP